MRIAAAILLICTIGCDGLIEHIPLPGGMAECFGRFSEKTNVADTVGESIASFCFGQFMWRASSELGIPGFNISREAYSWVQSLLKPTELRHKRQAPEIRIRKEYRRLTEQERNNYHAAVQMLKADTSVPPSMYDALSAIHQGIMTTSAHGGPNFLGFHRVYLLLYENALRTKIPSVTVPYWDSTLDEPLMNPTQSIIFTDNFMGNGFGIVNRGPFAGWITLSGPLIRNIGQSGQLFNINDMARIVSSLRLALITEPNAPVNSSLEFLHNQVHLWIDGQMGNLETAAHDPIFWLHHSYVDYIWELFRQNQRRFGIDPQTDYPSFVNDTMHMAMYPLGLAGLRNIEALSDSFTTMIYQYEPAPTCSVAIPDCGSPYLRCVMVGFQPRCVSIDWTGAARVSNFAQQQFMASVMQAQQMQAMTAAGNIGFANFQQPQMPIPNPAGMQQPMNMPMGEAEGGGLDDPSESHLQKRRSIYRRHINRRYASHRRVSIKARSILQQDPRGSAFSKSHLNVDSNLQMPALFSSMPQNMLHNMKQNMQQTMPQGMPLHMLKSMSQNMPQGMPQFMPQGMPKGISMGMPQNMPQGMQQSIPQGMKKDMSMGMPQGMPQSMPQGMPKGISMGMTPNMPQGMPQSMPQGMPKGMSMGMPQGMPQNMPQGMQKGMSIGIPQNMPSNLQNDSNSMFMQPNMQDMCPAVPFEQGYQNMFNINGRSDIKQWVYIPVKIIYQRPPTYTHYASYPIVNGEVEAEDIYSPSSFSSVSQMVPNGKPASYQNCQAQEGGAGKVYISSHGLNYMGTYKEYAIVDHRLALSISTAYVAVKSPEFGASQVFLNAYDSCGRICQPFCKMAGATGFQRCSGALRVTSALPKMYGINYGDAVTHVWQFSKGDICPTMQDSSIYIQFHCNFKDTWPFAMQQPSAGGQRSLAAMDEYEEPETSSGPRPGGTACDVGNGCVLTSGCDKCVNGMKYQCLGACSMYTSCQNGAHQVFNCPAKTIFDPDDGVCVPGTCPNNPNNYWMGQKIWK